MIELRFSCDGVGCGAIGEHLLLVSRHGHLGRLSQLFGILAVTPFCNRFGEKVIERGFQQRDFDPVLGTFGSCYARADGSEIEFHDRGEGEGVFFRGDAKKVLGPVVIFNQFHEIIGSTGAPKIGEGFFVYGEVAHRGSIFGGHVGDGGAVGEGKFGGSRAVELDEFSDDFVLAKDLGDGEGRIGGGGGGGISRGTPTAKAALKTKSDPETRRPGEQTGLDTPVVLAVNGAH